MIPYTDRLNYCSSFINNVGYCQTVEKMLGIEVPPRAVWARTILSEFSRIMDHCVCNGSTLVDLGALTNFWYFFQPREEIYGLLESVCGARLTVSANRIGGLLAELPPTFEAHCRRLLEFIPPLIDDVDDAGRQEPDLPGPRGRHRGDHPARTRSTGAGPDPACAPPASPTTCARRIPTTSTTRSTGRCRCSRAATSTTASACAWLEIRQSLSIIRQLLDRGMPEGPCIVDDPHVALPTKEACYNQMESMIYHFKLIMDGIQVPPGERYGMVEGANGELGFYCVSDGSGKPYRIKVRPPCFPIFSTFSTLMMGHTISDVIATLGGLNVIAGELDR